MYPYTLEPHVLALEAARRSTLAAHAARLEALLNARAERKARAQAEALRRVAPGFEPQGGMLVPDKVVRTGSGVGGEKEGDGGEEQKPGHERQRSVMDDLVDHLAALESLSGGRSGATGGNSKSGDIL